MKKSWILILMISSLIFGCRKNEGNKPCDMQVVLCTAIFDIVIVHVMDSQNQPVVLDEVYTIRKSTGQRIDQVQSMRANGNYDVLDDLYRHTMSNSSGLFQFIGIKNGRRVVDEVYNISIDCCHVQKVNGKDTIVVLP